MPELPEVQTVMSQLRPLITGATITELIDVSGVCISDNDEDAYPLQILDVARRGKYIKIITDKKMIVVHLRMTGKLVFNNETHPHSRAIIATSVGDIQFIDPRKFGTIKVENLGEEPAYLQKLGVEPLGPAFTARYLQKMFAKRILPIKNALLNQQIIAGLGNIYACEILYRCGIDPKTPVKDISLRKLKEIVIESKIVLTESIELGGTSVNNYRQIDDKSGRFQDFLKVYQQDHCPLDHTIKRIKQAGRSTYYCPSCQK